MKPASRSRNKHHNKMISRPARLATAWRAALAGLVLAIGLVFFGARAQARRPAAHAPQTEPGRRMAEKDVQVGHFYFNIGKYDAAVSRFRSAVAHDPRWAVPHRWLGEAFEKKNDLKSAIAEYREYLKMAPHAKDAKKIRRQLKKLVQEMKDRTAGNR